MVLKIAVLAPMPMVRRQYRGQRKSRRLPQLAQRVTQVLKQGLHGTPLNPLLILF